eukprot:4833520-Alexandrium_andersonii.AAC.1
MRSVVRLQLSAWTDLTGRRGRAGAVSRVRESSPQASWSTGLLADAASDSCQARRLPGPGACPALGCWRV